METFEAFFGREYRRVLGLAYALSGDWVVAEKVTADGFAAAHARWNQVSVLNSPGAWVSKPVSEAAIRASRKSTPESTPLLEGSEVWDSVRQLPKPQARIIALSYVTGASQREIAVLLRESEETIATSLEVGRTQLEQMMGVDGHGDRILRGAADQLGDHLAQIPIPPLAPTRHRPRGRTAIMVVASILLVSLIAVTASILGTPDTTLPITEPETTLAPTTTDAPTIPTAPTLPTGSGPVLGTLRGVVLLFNHGVEAEHDLVAVDVERGLVSETPLAGLRPGDPPYPMLLVGGSIVAGFGDVYATDLTTREETHLGQATIFLPAAENDRVWMIDYPGGSVGSGDPTVWQVGLDGEQLTEPVELSGPGSPVAGTPGGLALQIDTGLVLWDAGSGEWVMRLEEGSSTAWVLDTGPEQLVWCADPCVEIVVTSLPDLESTRYLTPDGYTVHVGDFGHVSPDGSYFAAVMSHSERPRETSLWALDLRSGLGQHMRHQQSLDSFSWSPSGTHLFAITSSYGSFRTSLSWWDLASGSQTSAGWQLGGLLDMIAVYVTDIDMDLFFTPENSRPFPPTG